MNIDNLADFIKPIENPRTEIYHPKPILKGPFRVEKKLLSYSLMHGLDSSQEKEYEYFQRFDDVFHKASINHIQYQVAPNVWVKTKRWSPEKKEFYNLNEEDFIQHCKDIFERTKFEVRPPKVKDVAEVVYLEDENDNIFVFAYDKNLNRLNPRTEIFHPKPLGPRFRYTNLHKTYMGEIEKKYFNTFDEARNYSETNYVPFESSSISVEYQVAPNIWCKTHRWSYNKEGFENINEIDFVEQCELIYGKSGYNSSTTPRYTAETVVFENASGVVFLYYYDKDGNMINPRTEIFHPKPPPKTKRDMIIDDLKAQAVSNYDISFEYNRAKVEIIKYYICSNKPIMDSVILAEGWPGHFFDSVADYDDSIFPLIIYSYNIKFPRKDDDNFVVDFDDTAYSWVSWSALNVSNFYEADTLFVSNPRTEIYHPKPEKRMNIKAIAISDTSHLLFDIEPVFIRHYERYGKDEDADDFIEGIVASYISDNFGLETLGDIPINLYEYRYGGDAFSEDNIGYIGETITDKKAKDFFEKEQPYTVLINTEDLDNYLIFERGWYPPTLEEMSGHSIGKKNPRTEIYHPKPKSKYRIKFPEEFLDETRQYLYCNTFESALSMIDEMTNRHMYYEVIPNIWVGTDKLTMTQKIGKSNMSEEEFNEHCNEIYESEKNKFQYKLGEMQQDDLGRTTQTYVIFEIEIYESKHGDVYEIYISKPVEQLNPRTEIFHPKPMSLFDCFAKLCMFMDEDEPYDEKVESEARKAFEALKFDKELNRKFKLMNLTPGTCRGDPDDINQNIDTITFDNLINEDETLSSRHYSDFAMALENEFEDMINELRPGWERNYDRSGQHCYFDKRGHMMIYSYPNKVKEFRNEKEARNYILEKTCEKCDDLDIEEYVPDGEEDNPRTEIYHPPVYPKVELYWTSDRDTLFAFVPFKKYIKDYVDKEFNIRYWINLYPGSAEEAELSVSSDKDYHIKNLYYNLFTNKEEAMKWCEQDAARRIYERSRKTNPPQKMARCEVCDKPAPIYAGTCYCKACLEAYLDNPRTEIYHPKPEKIPSGAEMFRYLYIVRGDKYLTLHLNEKGKQEIQENPDFEFQDLFDDVSGNSEYVYFDDISYLGELSNAPVIVYKIDFDDSGEYFITQNSEVFVYDDYQITNFYEVLKKQGYVNFTMVVEQKNPRTEIYHPKPRIKIEDIIDKEHSIPWKHGIISFWLSSDDMFRPISEAHESEYITFSLIDTKTHKVLWGSYKTGYDGCAISLDEVKFQIDSNGINAILPTDTILYLIEINMIKDFKHYKELKNILNNFGEKDYQEFFVERHPISSLNPRTEIYHPKPISNKERLTNVIENYRKKLKESNPYMDWFDILRDEMYSKHQTYDDNTCPPYSIRLDSYSSSNELYSIIAPDGTTYDIYYYSSDPKNIKIITVNPD